VENGGLPRWQTPPRQNFQYSIFWMFEPNIGDHLGLQTVPICYGPKYKPEQID
jgi:hypothetical protein